MFTVNIVMEDVYIQFIYGHIFFIMAIIIMYVNPNFLLFIKHPYFILTGYARYQALMTTDDNIMNITTSKCIDE